MDHLEDVRKRPNEKGCAKKMIITDGVFSMDGDIATMPDIVNLAEQYDALVMIDDAHASGVLGKNGAGTTSHFGLYGRVDRCWRLPDSRGRSLVRLVRLCTSLRCAALAQHRRCPVGHVPVHGRSEWGRVGEECGPRGVGDHSDNTRVNATQCAR